MKLDIEKAIRFPKDDPQWLSKLGVLFAIQIGISLLSTIFQFTPDLAPILEDSGVETAVGLGAIFGMLFLFAISLPFTFYLTGYQFELGHNVMKGLDNPLPDHSDIIRKFKLFGVSFLIGIGPVFIIGFILALLATPFIFLISLDVAAALMVLYGIFLFVVAFAALLATGFVIVPSMIFIYLKTGSVGEAYKLQNITSVATEAWGSFLKVGLVGIAIGIVAGSLAAATWICLLGWLVTPIVQIWMSLTQWHMYGQVFKDLDQFEL